MAPNAGDKSLDTILVSDLVDRSSAIGLKHGLVQLSLYRYLETTRNVGWVEMEYPLKYIETFKAKKYQKERHRHNRHNRHMPSGIEYKDHAFTWAVDVALIYKDGDKRVCEFIEVETINISEYWERFSNIRSKINKVETICKNKHINLILNDIDEVRFSLALNAGGLSDDERERLVSEFTERFDGVEYKNGVKAFNLYILKGDVYKFCPKNLNEKMLKAVGYLHPQGDAWREPFKEVMTAAYREIKKQSSDEISSLYAIKPFKSTSQSAH